MQLAGIHPSVSASKNDQSPSHLSQGDFSTITQSKPSTSAQNNESDTQKTQSSMSGPNIGSWSSSSPINDTQNQSQSKPSTVQTRSQRTPSGEESVPSSTGAVTVSPPSVEKESHRTKRMIVTAVLVVALATIVATVLLWK